MRVTECGGVRERERGREGGNCSSLPGEEREKGRVLDYGRTYLGLGSAVWAALGPLLSSKVLNL